MLTKGNAPARKGEGAVCLLAGDTSVYATEVLRVQHLNRFGIPSTRAAILAPFAFGEVHHV